MALMVQGPASVLDGHRSTVARLFSNAAKPLPENGCYGKSGGSHRVSGVRCGRCCICCHACLAAIDRCIATLACNRTSWARAQASIASDRSHRLRTIRSANGSLWFIRAVFGSPLTTARAQGECAKHIVSSWFGSEPSAQINSRAAPQIERDHPREAPRADGATAPAFHPA